MTTTNDGDARARTIRRPPPSWMSQVATVLGKDLAIEMATGEVVTTSGFFALLVVVVASVALHGGPDAGVRVAPGVLWVAVSFAAVLALGRTWQREREEAALRSLLVAPIARSAIFAGKALGVLLFVLAIEAVAVPAVAVLFSIDLGRVVGGLTIVVLLATPGVAASGTLFGAMTVRTRARDLVLAAVLFPLLAPSLLCAVAATRDLLDGARIGEVGDWLRLMLVFDVVFWAGGLGLFGTLVEEG